MPVGTPCLVSPRQCRCRDIRFEKDRKQSELAEYSYYNPIHDKGLCQLSAVIPFARFVSLAATDYLSDNARQAFGASGNLGKI
jgi:hypothetical protein